MTLATLLLIALFANAQMLNPVKFSTQLKTNGTAEAEIVFSGKIDAGWHVYSTNLGSDGPISATFNVTKLDGVELVGKLTPRGKEIAQYDKLFEMKLRYFEGSVQFVQIWNTVLAMIKTVCRRRRSVSNRAGNRLPWLLIK